MMNNTTKLPKLQLVFTLDYEIFGDGSGSVEQEQCLPTDYLARLLELHGGRLTLFAETGQQIYFRAHALDDRAAPVEAQMRALLARGHDVQLHIHPMWFFAPPPRDGVVSLDPELFDLSLLPRADIMRIVGQSVDYLKSVLCPICPNYAPRAYRAGAWSMRNTDVLFDILHDHGIRIDSTFAPGAHLKGGGYGEFDYSAIKMQPSWREGPLLELPILTARDAFSAWHYANPFGIRTRKLVGKRYKSRLTVRKKSRLRQLFEAATRDYHMADFNFLSPQRLAMMIQQHASAHASLETLPIILIGHSKATYYADRVHELFYELDRMNLRYETVALSQLAHPFDAAATPGHQSRSPNE